MLFLDGIFGMINMLCELFNLKRENEIWLRNKSMISKDDFIPPLAWAQFHRAAKQKHLLSMKFLSYNNST